MSKAVGARRVMAGVGVLVGGTLLLGTAPLAGAQTSGDPASSDPLETVTVFGSRLQNRTAFDSPVPIDVFKPADIADASSSAELGQVLQALSPAINMPRASSSGTSDSIRAIQLRGLAPDQVLVLVNGKRWHTNAVMDVEGIFPGTVAVDVNAIPVDAIDRIEILRDGAGAMYGSDAIAGVVNIVLKAGAAPASAGIGFGENHTHLVPTNSTVTDGENRTAGADAGIRLGDGGFVRFGASYQNRASTNRAGPTSSAFASFNNTPADQALDGLVLFQSGDPKIESTGLFYDAELPLAGDTKLYSFATANWRSTRGAAFFRYPGDPSNVPAIHPQGFRPVSTGASNDLGLVAGAKGLAGAWTWDLSARLGLNEFSYGLINSVNASLGAASPTQFHVAGFSTNQDGVNVDVTRKLDAGLAAPMVLSLGAEHLFEHYHTEPGDPASYATGPFRMNAFGETIPPGSQGDNGLRPQDAVHLQRNQSSLYAELESDVTASLLLDVAGRYSHYSDYGSSTKGKLSARYKITDNLLLRGSVSNSFRAPALAQTGIRFATLNFNTAPGSNGLPLQNNAWLPPTDPIAEQVGGQLLKPENSVNTSAGIAFRPAARTAATLDFYQIRITDRITPTGQLTPPASAPPDIASVQYLTNALDTTTRGFDLVVSHDETLASGNLRLSAAFNRNYLHEDRERNPNLLGGIVLVPLEYGTPATKLVLGADWSGGRFGAHAAATRFGTMYTFSFDSSLPTVNVPTTIGSNVQSYSPAWSIDLEARVSIADSVTLVLGGTDVFNRYPDQTTAGGNYGGALPYNFVQPLGINGAYYYTSLRATFGR